MTTISSISPLNPWGDAVMPATAVATTAHDRLLDAIAYTIGDTVDRAAAEPLQRIPMTDPVALTGGLTPLLPGRFSLTGTLDRRLLLAERAPGLDGWAVADLSGQPHATRAWPPWTQGRIAIDDTNRWLSTATLTAEAIHRVRNPRVLLVALYHPEWFPLPRFPLAISDLARAARSTLAGQVRLMDMQLGVTLKDILAAVATWEPAIVGVSATFGQHDLLTALLDQMSTLPVPPLMLAGGSLTVRNEHLLLDRYPRLLIARGAGEPTIADIVGYFHGDLELADVRGVGYVGAARGGGLAVGGRHQRTAGVANRTQTDFLPELDLLDATFDHKGVAQLEASRGCTNFCSFCPRGHKGTWAGGTPDALVWILQQMGQVFDRHPTVSRTLYLVDEEAIGADADAVPRALALAKTIRAAGFRWESSCRVDQVVAPDQNRAWHIERACLWRQLVAHGLRRMLFGVESGVSTVLDRFNKETTADQNALAIRTLSALGVPTRFTYITFDQLMDIGELEASHAFQARTDLLLRPLPHLSADEIVDGVRDEHFVATHSAGRPLYTGISYMLVSMECLIGAAYTRKVQAAGLAGAARPQLGRIDADFADWRIGRCSHHAQLWVDRNFALDYTLKSLEKILDGPPRSLVHGVRVTIKDAAFALLGRMLTLTAEASPSSPDVDRFDRALNAAMDDHLRRLRVVLTATIDGLLLNLPAEAAAVLRREHGRWEQAQAWRLINSADACGT
jgi:hypothetical protein